MFLLFSLLSGSSHHLGYRLDSTGDTSCLLTGQLLQTYDLLSSDLLSPVLSPVLSIGPSPLTS